MLILIAGLVAAGLLADQPESSRLTTVVRDSAGGLLAGARVTASSALSPTAACLTDGDGRCTLTLPAGRYRVEVDAAGFAPATRALDVARDLASIEVELQPQGITESVQVLETPSRIATKAATPVRETPQSIAIVPVELLEQQGALTLGDALRNVSGAALSGNWRGTYEIFAQRGFYSDSDGNFRRDGVEISKVTTLMTPDTERIEVLKGPASVLYGRIDPGGVINVVTRRPQAQRQHQLDLRAGGFGLVDVRADTTGTITAGGRALYRISAAWDRADSYRERVERGSTFVSPSLAFFFGSRARWDVDVEHKREHNTVDVGIAAPVNSFAALDAMPIGTFLGEEGADATLRYTNGLSTVEWLPGGRWTVRNVLSHTVYDRSSHDVTLGTLAADKRMVARNADFRESATQSSTAEVTALGELRTGFVSHRIAAGAMVHATSLDQQQFRLAIAPIDIFRPAYSGLPATLPIVADSVQDVHNVGFYVQNQMTLHPRLLAQAGVRVSRFAQETENRRTLVTQRIEADDVSPQFGVVVLPRPWLSVYGSYSESFAPNLAIAADGSTFGPKTANQYETGVKAEGWGGRASATLAAFRLTYEGNLSFIRDPQTGLFATVQGGVQRSRGIELDASVRPARGVWITGSFAWLDAGVVTDPVYLPGRPLGGAPKHRTNLWAAWESGRGFGVGAGVFQQTSFKEFTSSEFFLPGFTTVDAMASYRFSPNVIVRVHGRNLADERYYLSGAGNFIAYPAPPRHVTASLQLRFR